MLCQIEINYVYRSIARKIKYIQMFNLHYTFISHLVVAKLPKTVCFFCQIGSGPDNPVVLIFFFIFQITLLVIGSSLASTTLNTTSAEQESASLQLESLGKPDSADYEFAEVQKKRESRYSYVKPTRLPLNYRPSPVTRAGYRRRPHSRRPNQQIRPFAQYGLPRKNPLMQQGFVASTGQGASSSIKNSNFDQRDPIASQNIIPFGRNTALYLPPNNQPLPSYSQPSTFAQGTHQNLIQPNQNNHQISDAALFLSQNAQAISELYGAPAPNQDYAPSDETFDQNNQLAEQSEPHSQSNGLSQDFSGQLPGYASGILTNQETARNAQIDKDRLILQLQQALLQSQSARLSQESFNQGQNDHFSSEEAKYGFSYGAQAGSSSTTPTISNDGNLIASVQPSQAQSFAQYGGFPSTLVTSSNVIPNIPNYNDGFNGLNSNVPIRPIDAPTHFGLPLPSRPDQKPSLLPDSIGMSHLTPVIPARPAAPDVLVQPVSTPTQPARPLYLASPGTPVNPVTPIQSVVTPIIAHQGHAFGIQSMNPLVYKPLKSVYPFYYPGQKALSPMQTWSYPQRRSWKEI